MIGWGSFDLANQSFTLFINTFLFSIFVKEVVLQGNQKADFAWAMMASVSLGTVALIGPAFGAIADARASKKKFLITSGFICSILTCSFCFLPSGAAVGVTLALILAIVAYVPANILFNLGENFLASFLPEISSRETMGRISAFGWTLGYVGSLVLLLIMMVFFKVSSLPDMMKFRILFFFAGVWFAAMMIPTILYLREKRKPDERPAVNPVREALGRLAKTLHEATRFRDFARLLGSFFIYAMGVQTIIFFASLIARDDFEFELPFLVVFYTVITVFAGASAYLTGALQDRIGHKVTLSIFLSIWIVATVGLALVTYLRSQNPDSFPSWPLWLEGITIGLGLGGIGTTTRAAFGVMTPTHRTAEFFSLWGTSYKLAGVVGLPIFGAIRSWVGSVPSLIILAGFFLVGGFLVMKFVDMTRGSRAAIQAEEEHARETVTG